MIMSRFMKNGVAHQAIATTTEYFQIEQGKIERASYVMSTPEESAITGGLATYEWTPLGFIQWLPSSIQNQHTEFYLGTTGEIL